MRLTIVIGEMEATQGVRWDFFFPSSSSFFLRDEMLFFVID